jgi:hypothetical protein
MQAHPAYTACMQYTLRNIPKEVDAALRRKARQEGKSLNTVAVEALRLVTGTKPPVKYRDLDFLAGTWVDDPEFHKAIEAQDQIDWEIWR